jgi:hypothetical protein
MVSKTCTKCGRSFPATLEFFGMERKGKFGLRSLCKGCRALAAKEYAKTPKGKATNARGHKRYSSTTIRGRLNNMYHHIIDRCTNEENPAYHRYGGRGIVNCFGSFNEFADYVMNEMKADPRDLTIDRIDNDGNYERGNIRFVTHRVNCNNQERCYA